MGYPPLDGTGPLSGGAFGPQANMGRGHGMGGGAGIAGRFGGHDSSLIAVTADALGMDRTELVAELQGGKTIAQVAAEHDVALETIVDAFIAPREQRLAELVAAGQITQDAADSLLATMRANVTSHLNQPWSPKGARAGAGFVDENGDGVCDHAGTGARVGRQGRWGWQQLPRLQRTRPHNQVIKSRPAQTSRPRSFSRSSSRLPGTANDAPLAQLASLLIDKNN